MPRTGQIIRPISPELTRLEDLPQRVVPFGRDLAAGEVLPFHRHRRAQFVYSSTGVMTVTTARAAYVVPPQRAVWMPGGTEHRIDARSDVSMRSLYIETNEDDALPAEVRVLQVSTLLRELVVAAVDDGPEIAPDSPAARLAAVIVDQISAQPVASLALPIPTDPRLLRVVDGLMADPADPRDLAGWAAQAGASRRTLSRLFTAQTGMSFRAWRQQLRLHRALELLAGGRDVTTVAQDTGYDSTSAFIAMFRRCLGTTPARYLAADR